MHVRSKQIIVVLITLAAAAMAQMNIQVKLVGSVERDNKEVSVETPDLQLKTGEVITWTIEAINSDTTPARDFSPTARVPAGTEYVADSATGAAAIEFSIDGGISYSGKPMIRQRGPDNVMREVTAPTSSYTNIRFQMGNISPGVAKAAYQTRVR